MEATTILLKSAQVPNVNEVSLEFLHQYEQQPGLYFGNLCLAFYEFLADHAKSLKTLYCGIVTTRPHSKWLSIPQIPGQILNLSLENATLKVWGVRKIENLGKLVLSLGSLIRQRLTNKRQYYSYP